LGCLFLLGSSLFYSSKSNRTFSSANARKMDTNKLVINSKPEKVVFSNGKTVLMFPPLKPFLGLIENSTKDGKIICSNFKVYLEKFKYFHLALSNVLLNLESGYYNFEFYFYVNSLNSTDNVLIKVYTLDPFNKDCFNLVMGSYGYTDFVSIKICLSDEEDRKLIQTKLSYLIGERLREILENELSKSIIDLNKDTLVVISKTSKNNENEDNLKDKNNTFLPGVGIIQQKRLYSIYTKPILGEGYRNKYNF